MRFQIIWDLGDDPDGNVQHILEHGLSVADVEDVLLDDLSNTTLSRSSSNFVTFGYTSS